MGHLLPRFPRLLSAGGASGAGPRCSEAPAAGDHRHGKQRCSEKRTLSCPAQTEGVRAGVSGVVIQPTQPGGLLHPKAPQIHTSPWGLAVPLIASTFVEPLPKGSALPWWVFSCCWAGHCPLPTPLPCPPTSLLQHPQASALAFPTALFPGWKFLHPCMLSSSTPDWIPGVQWPPALTKVPEWSSHFGDALALLLQQQRQAGAGTSPVPMVWPQAMALLPQTMSWPPSWSYHGQESCLF